MRGFGLFKKYPIPHLQILWQIKYYYITMSVWNWIKRINMFYTLCFICIWYDCVYGTFPYAINTLKGGYVFFSGVCINFRIFFVDPDNLPITGTLDVDKSRFCWFIHFLLIGPKCVVQSIILGLVKSIFFLDSFCRY